MLNKAPSLESLSRTNFGGDDPENLNDISTTRFPYHYEKTGKGGAIFKKKRQSKSMDGDDDFKDNFEENLPLEFKN